MVYESLHSHLSRLFLGELLIYKGCFLLALLSGSAMTGCFYWWTI